MKNNLNKKTTTERKNKPTEPTSSEILEISRKREKDLQELDRIAKLLIRRDLELTETREKREAEFEELQKVKEELENAKSHLKIKVKARTRELEELTQNLEEQVKARTKELQEKLEILEKMNRLMIGRELMMVQLKNEIKKLKEKPEKY